MRTTIVVVLVTALLAYGCVSQQTVYYNSMQSLCGWFDLGYSQANPEQTPQVPDDMVATMQTFIDKCTWAKSRTSYKCLQKLKDQIDKGEPWSLIMPTIKAMEQGVRNGD